MRHPETTPRSLSGIIAAFAESPQESVTLGDLVDALGGRALAGLLLVFGLACTLPLPPGATTVFGLPLLLLAPQLVLGVAAPWAPRRVRERRLSMAQVRGVFERMIPWLRRMESVSRPRLAFVVGDLGQRLIGLICTLFALVLILPIPLGNMLPGATVTLFSLAMLQKDGALALAGYAFAAASLGILVLAANILLAAARHALSALPIA